MNKELPFFKFIPDKWISGDITTCSMEAQGVFANLCAFYWKRNADVDLQWVHKRFENYPEELEELIDKDIFQISQGGKISILFLDEQRSSFKPTRMVRTRWEDPCDVPSFRRDSVQKGKKKEKEEEKDIEFKKKKFEKRKQEFIDQVNEVDDLFPKGMREDFIDYWTETKMHGFTMRWEMQPTFDIKRRLSTWKRNQVKFGSNSSTRFGPGTGHKFSGHKFKTK